MSVLGQVYRHSLSLLTDLYQLTMAQGYFRQGMADHEAVFHMLFRRSPFGGGYAVACGVDYVAEYLAGLRFGADDLAYLAELKGNDGRALLGADFLAWLSSLRLRCDVDAVAEGTVVFPQEPLLRVSGPLPECQLVETPLLNLVNFQTLIATKASRICRAAKGEPVLEFGLRRAQGVDGALAASRASYVGGCAATSNVLAGKLFGIPVKGTHAHSWVMCFDDELSAFEAYAEAMPNNCVLLVDTYDTLAGVRRAIAVAGGLRRRGYEMIGIRLDSGDLARLSIDARRMLDEAGFPDVAIVASNDLDEAAIAELKRRGATIGVWGVGTRLATGYDQPALGGVYKLSAVRRPGGDWQYRLKLSEEALKVSPPGILQVRRFRRGGRYVADMVWDVRHAPEGDCTLVDATAPDRRETMAAGTEFEDLLTPLIRSGRVVREPRALSEARRAAAEQLDRLPEAVTRLAGPQQYFVGLERRLCELRDGLMDEARGQAMDPPVHPPRQEQEEGQP